MIIHIHHKDCHRIATTIKLITIWIANAAVPGDVDNADGAQWLRAGCEDVAVDVDDDVDDAPDDETW